MMTRRFRLDRTSSLFRAIASSTCILVLACSSCSKPSAQSAWKGNPATATRISDSSGVSAGFFLITYNSNFGFSKNEINHRRLSCSVSVDLGPADPAPLIFPTLEILELKDSNGVDLIPSTKFSSGTRSTHGADPSYGLWTFSPGLESKTQQNRRKSATSTLEASGAPDGRLAGLERVRARLVMWAANAVETIELPLSSTNPIPLGKDYTIRMLAQSGDSPGSLEAIIERNDGSAFIDARQAPVCLYDAEHRAKGPKDQPKPFTTRGVFKPHGIVLRFERAGFHSGPLFAPEDTLVLSFVTSYDKKTMDLEASDIPL